AARCARDVRREGHFFSPEPRRGVVGRYILHPAHRLFLIFADFFDGVWPCLAFPHFTLPGFGSQRRTTGRRTGGCRWGGGAVEVGDN
ncbi:hypothetical protein K523DRAFT_399507, partial [Schizophyllum commune Tattone D]